ncbi:hypothetical protein ABIC09_006055 [Bradyrhizobium sp. S3.12.5]|uniref:hypothetical protein n=1 Tax=Bradyrhizobium sp. S3.12.5 TaxID=3156386 RepID=UPI003397766A
MSNFVFSRRFLWVAAATSTITAVYGLTLAISFWRSFPYWDQWRAVVMYQAWTEQQMPLWQFLRDHIVAQHNEHRVPLTELAFLIDFIGFSGTSEFMFPLLILSYIGLGLVLGVVIACDATFSESMTWIAISLAFVLSPIQIDNLTLPFHLLWALSGLFSLGAFYWTAKLAIDKSPWQFALLACAATLLSVYNSANGLAAAGIVILMAETMITHCAPRTAIVATAVMSIMIYFVGYSAPESTKFHAILTSATGLYYFIAYFLALVGGIAAPFGLVVSRVVGAFGLSMAILVWAHASLREDLDAKTISLLALFSWAAISALMTAVGRGGIGAEQALWSRYGTIVVLFWLPLIGAIWRMTRNRPLSAACIPAALAILVLTCLSGLPFVAEARSRAALIDKTTDDLRSGRPDTSGINPPNLVDFLRRRHLSIFVAN